MKHWGMRSALLSVALLTAGTVYSQAGQTGQARTAIWAPKLNGPAPGELDCGVNSYCLCCG